MVMMWQSEERRTWEGTAVEGDAAVAVATEIRPKMEDKS